ncbi:hypothetical protein B0O80DRAFT_430303 [Mortierella sp. GBAus27b]|nr:hypothetical protein B0O80DRAFT_430303 [Mortierella sp. GBAus27b]
MATPTSLGYRQCRDCNELLPMDLMIQIFMHLCRHPQDLVNCALTTKSWAEPALQALYRHPWVYLFSYQYDTEGRVMDKHGSMLLLRTLLQGCMDPSTTTFPYASFARSVNLKWIHDTFDMPEVDIQALTGFRWTLNEEPKDLLIRHLLASRPYLSEFVHCHAPRLPRCLFAHMTTATANTLMHDIPATATANVVNGIAADEPMVAAEGSVAGAEVVSTDNNVSAASTSVGGDVMSQLDVLLATPPLLPLQQPIATAMPLVQPAATSSSAAAAIQASYLNALTLVLQVNNADLIMSNQVQQLVPSLTALESTLHEPEPQLGVEAISLPQVNDEAPTAEIDQPTEAIPAATEDHSQEAANQEPESHMAGILESTLIEPSPQASGQVVVQSLTAVLASAASSSTTPPNLAEAQPVYAFQQPFVPPLPPSHSRTTASSSTASSSRLFLATWPLTRDQTSSLVYLDLRFAIVSDHLISSLALTCRRIEYLKVATHWQHYPHSYSVTDHSLSYLVASQHGLKLVHIENQREISQGHELIRTINTLAKLHGTTLETLVLKSHDFQNCNLATLGLSCRKLVKFAAPGGVHLFREGILKLTEACKLTLEHLDFSNSDIETECLMGILKGMSTPEAARGKLKALILLGMEDTLNQETCLAIGEHASGLDCFRLDILESEARDSTCVY